MTPSGSDSTKIDSEVELEAIFQSLKQAHSYGLTSEVVWSAMRAIQQDSSVSIPTAFTMALMDWDC